MPYFSNKNVGESFQYYLPALDGMRFVAFVLVLVHHTSQQPAALDFIRWHGWIGVELFFAISSFLFFYLFKAATEVADKIDITNFYIRRMLRLYPLMIAYPLAMLVIYGVISKYSVGRLLGIAFFSDNFLTWFAWNAAIPYSAHLWTLSYEFQIYLVIPLAFLLYKWLGNRRFLWLLFAIWLIAVGARLAFILINVKHPVIWVTPFLRPESTLLGIVLSLGILSALSPHWVALVALLALIAFTQVSNVYTVDLSTLAVYPLAAVLCASALWAVMNSRIVAVALSMPLIVFLGKISFGLYVFHLLAVSLTDKSFVTAGFPPSSSPDNYALRILCSLLISTALASTSYFLFERHFLRLRSRFSAVESRPT
jgi:peptidoglycan/LPS O-acetylase OafA/YrhL